MKPIFKLISLGALALTTALPAWAEVTLTDLKGRTVTLRKTIMVRVKWARMEWQRRRRQLRPPVELNAIFVKVHARGNASCRL